MQFPIKIQCCSRGENLNTRCRVLVENRLLITRPFWEYWQ